METFNVLLPFQYPCTAFYLWKLIAVAMVIMPRNMGETLKMEGDLDMLWLLILFVLGIVLLEVVKISLNFHQLPQLTLLCNTE